MLINACNIILFKINITKMNYNIKISNSIKMSNSTKLRLQKLIMLSNSAHPRLNMPLVNTPQQIKLPKLLNTSLVNKTTVQVLKCSPKEDLTLLRLWLSHTFTHILRKATDTT
jgi:hypothetical protein